MFHFLKTEHYLKLQVKCKMFSEDSDEDRLIYIQYAD